MKKKEAIKHDKFKNRLELIPPEVIEAIGLVLTKGAEKYGDRNFELGMDWSRPYGATLRHLNKWWGGEDNDDEWGYSHLYHAITELMFLLVYEQRKIGKDNRHKIYDKKN